MQPGINKRRAPKSNTQRQREFRARNPGYYGRLHRKRKAEREAARALMAQHPELTFIEAYIRITTPAPPPEAPTPETQAPQAPLALPAARAEPLVTVQLPLFDQAPPPQVIATSPTEARPPMQLTPAQVIEQMKNAA